MASRENLWNSLEEEIHHKGHVLYLLLLMPEPITLNKIQMTISLSPTTISMIIPLTDDRRIVRTLNNYGKTLLQLRMYSLRTSYCKW